MENCLFKTFETNLKVQFIFMFMCHVQIHVTTSQMWLLHSQAPKRAVYNLCSIFFIFTATLYICKYNVMCGVFLNRCEINFFVSTLL